MMWFFAILIVLAMGGIAVVAAGRGTPMQPAYDDRPDSVVPADGELVGEDLRRVRFPLAFRGYRMAEVDALLDRVAAQLEAVEGLDTADQAPRDTRGPSDPTGEVPHVG
ncbi:MAG: DivIVA domain-containing protein [Nocardioides sp.]